MGTGGNILPLKQKTVETANSNPNSTTKIDKFLGSCDKMLNNNKLADIWDHSGFNAECNQYLIFKQTLKED